MSNDPVTTNKKKRSGRKSKKITFDEEVVPKDTAQIKIDVNIEPQNNIENKSNQITDTKRNKRQKITHDGSLLQNKSEKKNSETAKEKKPKRKNKVNIQSESNVSNNTDLTAERLNEQSELDPTNPKIPKEESIRSRKRKKYQQLLLEKKMKVDLVMQEKTLNYLSRWKHSRDEWKFEKLRQIWLQQNMFDSDRVPDKFWDTVVEYFSNAKGKIRQTIIDDALKIIEKGGSETVQDDEKEENEDEEDNNQLIQLQRAKAMIQSLQE